jgi:RNA polymerase sigma factor (TIGR02999 family)
MNGESEITLLLRAAQAGRAEAFDRLVPLVYDELRALARGMLGSERTGHTLGPTALVHESWLRLASQESFGFEHRAQFFAAAATSMRRVLVDHARTRAREKRGGDRRREPLDEMLEELERSSGDLLELEAALVELSALDARKARLVELRFFAGLDVRQSASVLAVSERQAERDWTLARAFLRGRLERARR